MDGVTREEVDELTKSGRPVVLLDVRTPEEFAAGTVAGARNVAPDLLLAEVPRLPEGVVVVTVCNHGGSRSRGAARTLREHGVATATHLVGGVKGPKAGH